MTKEQKIEMYSMRLDGHTLQEIGEKFGITGARVLQILPHEGVANRRIIERMESCKYPRIAQYMIDNNLSQSDFAKMIGTCQSNICSMLSGTHKPRKDTIDKMLRATGLTYEEAFFTTNGGKEEIT